MRHPKAKFGEVHSGTDHIFSSTSFLRIFQNFAENKSPPTFILVVGSQGLRPTLCGAEGDLGTARTGNQPKLYLVVAEVAVAVSEVLPADGGNGGLHDQNGPGRDELAGHSEPAPVRRILHLHAV